MKTHYKNMCWARD